METKSEMHISVRSLVEFLYRGGNIDNRRQVSSELAMSEGSRIHRMLQKKGGPGYHAEVTLNYRYETPQYDICLEGRADGVMEEYVPEDFLKIGQELPLFAPEFGIMETPKPLTYIDEIKGTYQKLERIKEPFEVHLAQAKCYAFITATEKELKEIGIRVTYCNIESNEIRYFHKTYNIEEIAAWFEETMQLCRKWMDYSYAWTRLRNRSIQELSFPYAYREGQKELASYVYQTIYHKRKLFLEAPTGVGKTLSTVFPGIKAVGQGLAEKIFYLTAKTITRTVAEETFALLGRFGLEFKEVVITAKEKICPNDSCECNPISCPYAEGHFDRVNDCLYALVTKEKHFSREIMEQYALEYRVCPYELSLDVSLFADGVICDYNYVFDPHVYLRRYFAGNQAGKYIFLIDEAHNLLERGREMYSAVLIKEDILEAKRIIKEHDKEIARYLDKLNRGLLAMKKQCDGLTVFEGAEEVYLAAVQVKSQTDIYMNKHPGSQVMEQFLDYYLDIYHFIMIYELMDSKYVIYGQLLENERFMLKLFNVDPSGNLKERMEQARSTILFSATLLPIQYYKELLGGTKEDYEVYAHSVFPPENRGLFIARDVTSKYTRRGEQEYQRIAEYLHEMVLAKQGNYMAFFPSYAFMEAVYGVYEKLYFDDHIACYLQQENMDELDRERFLNLFREESDHSVFGFCVLGGIFSEGIDLKHDSLIGAAIIGTGLPQVSREKELLKDYFEKQGMNGFDYAYRYPGMNKVLQAAGRVIRTAEDVGVVLLLDERFLQNSYQNLYPREWSNIQVVSLSNVTDKIREFHKEKI